MIKLTKVTRTKDTGYSILTGVGGLNNHPAIALPTSPQFDMASWTRIAVEFWFKTSTNATDSLFNISTNRLETDGSSIYLYVTRTQADKIIHFYTPAALIESGAINENTWNHIVIQYNGTKWQVYLNGSLLGEAVGTYTPTTWQSLYFGAAWWWGCAGSFKEIRVYKKFLSSGEITAHYNSGAGTYGQPETDLMAGYHCNDGTGQYLQDYSGNNQTANIYGSLNPTWNAENTISQDVNSEAYITDLGAVNGAEGFNGQVQLGLAGTQQVIYGKSFNFYTGDAAVSTFNINERGFVGINKANPIATLDVYGTMAVKTRALLSIEPVRNDDMVAITGPGGGTYTIYIPSAVKVGAGRLLFVKTAHSSIYNDNTIIAPLGGTLDGQASLRLRTPYESLMLVSDGTNWWTLNTHVNENAVFKSLSVTPAGALNFFGDGGIYAQEYLASLKKISGGDGAIGGGHGNVVTGVQSITWGDHTTNYSTLSITVGDYHNLANGSTLNAVFGSYNTGSAAAAHNIIAGQTNSTTGTHNAIFGKENEVYSHYNIVAGWKNTINSGTHNALFGGNDGPLVSQITGSYNIGAGNIIDITGSYSFGFGQYNNVIASYAGVIGLQAKATNYGQFTQSAGKFSNQGDAQTSVMVLRMQTTDDTATELALDGGTTYIKTEDNKSYTCEIMVVARDTSTGDTATWGNLLLSVKRGSGYATTVTLTSPTFYSPDWYDAGMSGLVVDISSDSASDGHLKITVTGIAATTINWVARVTMVEVGV